jgi:hypothetical protein
VRWGFEGTQKVRVNPLTRHLEYEHCARRRSFWSRTRSIEFAAHSQTDSGPVSTRQSWPLPLTAQTEIRTDAWRHLAFQLDATTDAVTHALASPSELVASPSELFASPSELLTSPRETSPSELLASPSGLFASPSELLTSSSELLTSPSELVVSPSELLASPSSRLSQVRVFLDGAFAGASSDVLRGSVRRWLDQTALLAVGHAFPGFTYETDTWVADYRMYTRVLDDAQVQAVANP